MTRPFAFYPISFKKKIIPKIWGGKKIENFFSLECLEKNIGESWEVSVIKEFVSVVNNGIFKNKKLDALIEKYPIEILGEKVYTKYGINFPLLIKFIDVSKPLSIQVHPDDEIAEARHNSFGKNETWFIIETKKMQIFQLVLTKKLIKKHS